MEKENIYVERGFKASKGVRRRSRLDIIADVLDASRGRVRKTHLMYKCSMSFTQIAGYLDLILGAKLLVVENDGTNLLFRISIKGRSFLKSYQGLKALME
jgi:predicted transcriptional regulator